MFFRVLGPVQISFGEQTFSPGTLKAQSILAILLLEAGRVVSAQTLAEWLWDDDLPSKARGNVQVYISRLRRTLREAGDGAELIARSPAGGYRLDVGADQVDVRCFDALLARARAAVGERRLDQAADLLREADALWTGEPLEGLGGQLPEAMREALVHKRRAARLARMDLEVQLGEGGEGLLGELTVAAFGRQVDQRAVGLLMRALERDGRQGEALSVFRRVRSRLRADLAIDPSRELEQLHTRILRGERPASAPPSPGSVLRAGAAENSLDRDPPHLTGRDGLVLDLVDAVRSDLANNSGVAVFALDGLAGVGKTAVAVRTAHRLARDFPGGLLQVNLRTHDPRRSALDVPQALVVLLEALATPTQEISRAHSFDALAALWRRRCAGRRMLLLLDDVAAFDDITPLIPSSPGSIILATSRRRLPGLVGARQFTVPPLPQGACVQLLERVTGRTLTDQGADAHRFAQACGGLPLAVTVAGAYLRTRSAWSVADLVARMAAAAEPEPEDPVTGPVTVALSLSYRELSGPHRRLLRQVAALPGADFGLHAAAAAHGAEPGRVDLDLDLLAEHHLIEESARHRYRLHDLVRAYALSQIQAENDASGAQAAAGRVTAFYLATAARAEALLRPDRRPPRRAVDPHWSEPCFPDPPAADAWLAEEYANMHHLSTGDQLPPGSPELAALAGILAKFLDRTGRWHHAVEILERAVRDNPAYSIAPVLRAEVRADLAAAYIRTGLLDAALEQADTALETFTCAGDGHGLGDALLETGRILRLTGQYARAELTLERAVVTYRQIGHDRGQAVAAYQRAIALFHLGRHPEAMTLCAAVVVRARDLGDQALLCDALTNLGEMHRLQGHNAEARHYFEQAQPLARAIGDPHNIAALLNNIAAVYHIDGDHAQALQAYHEELRFLTILEDRSSQADVHLALAEIRGHLHDFEGAEGHLEQAGTFLEPAAQPQAHYKLAMARGAVYQQQGKIADTAAAYRTALEYASSPACAPADHVSALRALAGALIIQGDQRAADAYRSQADALDRKLAGAGTDPGRIEIR